MGLMSKIFGNTRKPEGFWGRMMVNGMNGGSHARLAQWGLAYLPLSPNAQVLDCGCGGGANLSRLLDKLPGGKVCGLDYSEVSVAKSKEHNKAAIADGRCAVVQGNVAALPFDDESFDAVTAFETVYFWPDLAESFREIRRVLKPGGRFLIVNESNGRNEKSLKWTKIIDGMRVYTGEELTKLLEGAGFADIELDDDNQNDRLRIRAVRK